jgi:hypothetical protein
MDKEGISWSVHVKCKILGVDLHFCTSYFLVHLIYLKEAQDPSLIQKTANLVIRVKAQSHCVRQSMVSTTPNGTLTQNGTCFTFL